MKKKRKMILYLSHKKRVREEVIDMKTLSGRGSSRERKGRKKKQGKAVERVFAQRKDDI